MIMKQTDKQWETFANKDPQYYIFANKKTHNDTVFWSSGLEDVKKISSFFLPNIQNGRMLEIGCGMGRMSNHFAQRVKHLDAVDMSQRMIELAIHNAREKNIVFQKIDGTGSLNIFSDNTFDIIVTWHVMQHIVDYSIIENYLREIYRVLKTGEHAILHFDTRKQSIASFFLASIPPVFDFFLPTKWRYGMRRNRRDRTIVNKLMTSIGFLMVQEIEPDTDKHLYILQK